MSNVTQAHMATTVDIPVSDVIDGAKVADLAEVFVLGVTNDGKAYHASSTGDFGRLLLMLLRARNALARRDLITED